MAKLKAGFIGFIPFGTQGDDYYKTLAEYAAIGYKGTEHGAFLFNGDVDANLARIKEIGIEPIVMGMGGGRPGTRRSHDGRSGREVPQDRRQARGHLHQRHGYVPVCRSYVPGPAHL